LAVALSDARCEAVIDENGFERALMNLVVNARQATSTSGVITVTAKIVAVAPSDRRTWPGLASGQYVACSVEDQGEGIPPHLVSRVFDPFFTTKAEGKGTGLGLSQVFRFARQCGGGVYVQSKLGSGTTVTLMLPLAT
jgi:signal transduction histidine kinase